MKWKLFLDLEVIEFLGTMPPRQRERFVRLFRRIREFPSNLAEFHETDETGREHSGIIFDGFAIFYWEDFADRHVKVMRICPADERPG